MTCSASRPPALAASSAGRRSRASSRPRSAALAVALVFVPVLLGSNATQKLTSLLILVLLAVMWNALAGYGGLVSVGQQAFIGLGAYGTVFLVDTA